MLNSKFCVGILDWYPCCIEKSKMECMYVCMYVCMYACIHIHNNNNNDFMMKYSGRYKS